MQQTIRKREQDMEMFSVKLKEYLGTEKVKDDELSCITYSADVSPVTPQTPLCVVFPENRDDVVTALKTANEYKVPLTVMSGGVNAVGTTIPPKGGFVMDLHRMSRVIEINTDSGYAVIEPGVDFNRYTAALREKGFRCAVPTTPGGATPLGNSLSRPSSSLATRHLDSIVDLEVVLPNGTVLNTGSSQFPNVGSQLRYGPFPDMAGLFCCSYGTLGVITKAALRIYPINEANRVTIAGFDRYEDSVDFIKDLTNHNIPEHCIIWNWQFYKAFEVGLVGDEYKVPSDLRRLDARKPPKDVPYVIVTVSMSGYEETMRSHERVCAKVAAKYGGRLLSKKEAKAIAPAGFAAWTELYGNHRTIEPNNFGIGKYLAWIVLTEPEKVIGLEKWAMDEFAKFGTLPVCYYSMPFDFGRAMFFRIFCFPDPENDELVTKIVTKYREMYDVAMKRYGGIPLRAKMGFPTLAIVGGYGEALKKIKQAFDPNGILSPNMGIYEEVPL
jgi:FAD/FMN-containing dehydrogenase